MKAKRFTARNMQQALRMVSDELGPDAVILSNKRVAQGVEVVAALDFQELTQDQQQQELDRQLSLQKELEQAKQATQKIREEEPQVMNQALSETSALKDMLTDLKQQLHASASDSANGSDHGSGKNSGTPEINISAAANTATATDKVTDLPRPEVNQPQVNVSEELNDLKNWLISQQGNAWNPNRPLNWQQAQIWQRCQDLGIDPSWADKLVSHLSEDEDIEKSWADCLSLIAEDLPLASNNMLQVGGVYAFVGPTGAGKTTTIGKLAAQFVMNHGSDQVAIVTMDNYRIAAHDQLKAFARIMEVPLHIVPPRGDLNEVLETLQDRKFILIDTAGLASQDPHFSVQLSMLKQVGRKVKTLLTLPLTSQARCLQENYEHFKAAGIDGCVFTKLDECFSLGQAMSVAAVTRLPLHMVTDGPHIPDDIHFPDAKKMVRLAEQMARMAQTRWQTSEISAANTNNTMQHGA